MIPPAARRAGGGGAGHAALGADGSMMLAPRAALRTITRKRYRGAICYEGEDAPAVLIHSNGWNTKMIMW